MRSSGKVFLIKLLVVGLCVTAALICRRHAPYPFVWTYALIGVALCIAMTSFKGAVFQYAGIVFLALFLALSGGELYFGLVEAPELARADAGSENEDAPSYRRYTEDGKSVVWTRQDPVTGYRAKSSARVRAVLVRDGVTIYDISYSTDEDGWRITPQHKDATRAVVFFGCSYTFGEALDDRDTFVWKTAELLGEEYQVFNFAFSGNGPHQFLALVEAGILGPITKRYSSTHVFFLSLEGHELRSAGYSSWDAWGPWYEEENGRAVRKGTFADRTGGFRTAVNRFFRKSRIYALFFVEARKTEEAPSRALQAAIISTAAKEVMALPGADFTLLYWPGNEQIADDLRGKDLRILSLLPALPGYERDRSQYDIPGDGHPNAYASSLVAAFLAEEVSARD